MKTLKKALVTGLVAVMMVVNLAGCGKFDAAAYVESCLDLLTKGETEQYMKMNARMQVIPMTGTPRRILIDNPDSYKTPKGFTGVVFIEDGLMD